MNQKDIVKIVSKKTGLTQPEVNKVFNAIFDTIKDRLFFGYDVRVLGFCTFKKVALKSRTFTLPSGDTVKRPKRYIIKPVMSKVFLDKIGEQSVYDG